MADGTYTNDDAIAAYLTGTLEEAQFAEFIEGTGHVARSRGISSVSRSSGLGRESLYKALSAGAKPRFETVCKVLKSLGLKLVVVPDRPAQPDE